MDNEKIIEKLLQAKSKDAFNDIAREDNIRLSELPKNAIEHYKHLCEKYLDEAKKNPLYEESPYSHSDPREAFIKK